MKKILFTIALIITLGLTASAQFNNITTDAFFNDWEQSERLMEGGFSFVLPASHGFGVDTPAPLGSGLLVFTALGAGYALKRKREKL